MNFIRPTNKDSTVTIAARLRCNGYICVTINITHFGRFYLPILTAGRILYNTQSIHPQELNSEVASNGYRVLDCLREGVKSNTVLVVVYVLLRCDDGLLGAPAVTERNVPVWLAIGFV
jgi:hypothetical protein